MAAEVQLNDLLDEFASDIGQMKKQHMLDRAQLRAELRVSTEQLRTLVTELQRLQELCRQHNIDPTPPQDDADKESVHPGESSEPQSAAPPTEPKQSKPERQGKTPQVTDPTGQEGE